MAQFKFLKGNYSGLSNVAITEGQIMITKDTREMFVDIDASTRIKIGDFIVVANIAALEALDATAVPTSRLYYVEDGNILARSNGTTWIQVNKQPTTEELKTLLGLGSLAYKSEVAEGDLNTDLAKKINDASTANHSHENKDVIDGITAEKVSAWDAAEQNAKDYADDQIEALALGTMSKETANDYVKKSDATGYDDILTKTEAQDTYQPKGDYAAAEHDHVAADITDLDDTIKAYDYATKTELGNVDAKFDNYKTAADQKVIDDEQDRRLGVLEGASVTHATKDELAGVDAKFADYTKTADLPTDLGDFTNNAGYAKTTDVNTELAKKADKSVVDAMYTNEQIDEFIQGAKDYADTNDADTKYGITYDSENKKIKLVEGGTEAEIDATAFIKDGMIETVALSEDGLNLVITWNTDAGKSETTIPLTGLVDVYTGVSGDRITVSVSSDDKISADLVAGSISKNYLDDGVQASLAKADSALQEHQDISHLATTEALNGVDAKFANYTNTTDMNAALDLKADKTQVATDIATAKGEAEAKAAELDAALKTELQAEIDADVKALADGAVKDNADAIAELTQTVADNAEAANGAVEELAGNVYTKEQTYTQDEVDAAIEAAVTAATEWGSF